MYKLFIKTKDAARPFRYIFISALFLAFHYFLVVYINSTFLGQVIGRESIGWLYATGALVNIAVLLKMPRWLSKYGTYSVMLLISIIEIALLCLMAVSESPILILGAFIVHHALTPLLLMCLDVTIEDSAPSKDIGKVRGSFLTILAIASVISPLIIGAFLAGNNGFEQIYLFSAMFMVLFTLTVWRNFAKSERGTYKAVNIKKEMKEFWKDKNIRNIGFCNIVLQFFFSWMVVYIPIYLLEVGGFTWSEIGVMISITLLPFILLEIPVGEMADKRFGEKEMLLIGLVIAAIATLFLPYLPPGNFVMWTAVIFAARAGASVIETMIESYFFKKTKGKDELIAVFRMGTPIAFILGPALGSVALLAFGFKQIFFLLTIVLVIGVFFASRIRDTR